MSDTKWKLPIQELPIDGYFCWIKTIYQSNTPCTADYNASTQTFFTYPTNLTIPAYQVWKWRYYG